MKWLKRFENNSSNNFELSEIGDIIREFADVFEIEDEDDILFGSSSDSYINLEDLSTIDKLDLQLSNSEFEDKYNFEKIERTLAIRLHLSRLENLNVNYFDIGKNAVFDFNKSCDSYIDIFNKLKSFSGKLETFGLEIVTDSLDFDLIQDYAISFLIDK
jgi:hypothetical protein